MENEQHTGQSPYGGTVRKQGVSPRRKAALAVGAAVIAGGGLIGYEMHSDNAAESEAKAQEIALKSKALELEKIRELNRAAKSGREESEARQKAIDTCVKDNASKIGAVGSPSYGDVVNDCQAQYAGTSPVTGDDMETAASSDSSEAGGDALAPGLLVGVGLAGLALAIAAKRGRRTTYYGYRS